MTEPAGQREMDNLRRLLALAVAEDLGDGDVSGELLPADLQAEATFAARHELVFCGGVFLAKIAAAYDERIVTDVAVTDGSTAAAGVELARWRGAARGILAAERVALNFLQHLSGIATTTRRFVDAARAGAAAGGVATPEILDTRKTTPGWRDLEKYAVRCGGGRNHRRGLYDAVLVKDNHLGVLARSGSGDALAGLAERLDQARRRLGPGGFVEVEVDTLEQLAGALALPLDAVLLDNMSCEQMRRAVSVRDAAGLAGRVKLEASGGITLATVGAAAATSVDRISVGALTHSAAAADIGLDVELGQATCQ